MMFLKFRSKKSDSAGLPEMPDEELLQAYLKDRNPDFAGELFKRYTHLVYGVCLKYLANEDDAKDAVMQVFEKLLEMKQGTEIQSFKAWIHTVAKNHCLMHLRHLKAEERMLNVKYIELKDDIMENPSFVHLDDKDRHEARVRKLKESLLKLNEEQKKCVELFYLNEMSYKEISELTGFDLNKVKSAIQNGKRNLQLMMNHGSEHTY